MEQIFIRKLSIHDLEQLQSISRQTFYETFSAFNTEQDMNKYLDEGFALEKLMAELNDPNSSFYFAALGSKVVGYIKLNKGSSQTELKENNAMEIERIYVLNEFQGKGVGQLLYEKAMQVAKDNSADYIWLGVWEDNTSAIKFYKKNGFVEFGKHIFKLGDDEQTDIMMKLEL